MAPTPFRLTQRCADIVDRSKKTSDVTKWTGLCAPFRNRRARFTFEIDDVGVAVGNQNLAKMKIAVNSSHDHTYAETREHANGIEKAAELTLKHFGAVAILLALPSLEPCDIVESQTDALFRLPRPVFGVVAVRNLGCKGGIATFLHQYGVHFAKALADRRHYGLAI